MLRPLFLIGIAFLILAPSAEALTLPKSTDGFYRTGNGIRYKKVLLIDVQVYHATHEMKMIPNPPTRRNIILADVDKRTTITMLRDVDIEDILEGIRAGYAMNDYTDETVLQKFLAPLTEDLAEGETFRISYDAETQTTSLLTRRGKSVIPGKEFMHATWATWFQNHERPELTDELMKNLLPSEGAR
ncbi:MAG: chalcone isomerase family protein [Candidatus Omnitrophica bacterium]|nr:chalcone isomerase family protein [Candidatus Omnitrophota bacterium]